MAFLGAQDLTAFLSNTPSLKYLQISKKLSPRRIQAKNLGLAWMPTQLDGHISTNEEF